MKRFTASGKFLRISTRKLLMSIPKINGIKVSHAQSILQNLPTKSAKIVLKILNSAVANAKAKDAQEENLYFQNIIINQGTRFKRMKIRSRGTADVINKPTSHIFLEIVEKKPRKKVKKSNKKLKEAKNGT